ncbi:MAG: hypothetical protein ACUVTQ_07175 [Desulfotomaculales bacterium]
MSEIVQLLAEDNREKRMARGGRAVGKERPQVLRLPSSLAPAWWRAAPAIVRVNIITGEILVFAWPLCDMVKTCG